MADSKLHSIQFKFNIQDGRKLKPGDIIPSSCPPTETVLDGRSVVYSPGGVPLHFKLELVYAKDMALSPDPDYADPWFLLRLHVEQPSFMPCLPPLQVQPMPISIPRKTGYYNPPRRVDLVPRLVGPHQPANWGFRWEVTVRSSTWTGEFQFQLVDEPLHLMAYVPPFSEADWSCLPPDMISAVLRELPLPDLVSARLVCKEWERILDTDFRVWSNIGHLQSLGMGVGREGPYDYHDGRLNQVRYHKLVKALGFLASRKAPINTLELVYHGVFNEFTELLPSVLSQHNMELKAFSLQCPKGQDAKFSAAVIRLMRSQPSLERVYLKSEQPVPLPLLLEALPRLRILSIYKLFEKDLQAFQTHSPQLCRLDGLRVGSPTPNVVAVISNSLASHNSHLRQVECVKLPEGYRCSCGCETFKPVAVWGSGNLSPAAAAFLLMPYHYGMRTANVLHHHL